MIASRRHPAATACAVAVSALLLSACGGTAEDPPWDTTEPVVSLTSPADDGPLEIEVEVDSLQVSPTLDRVKLDIGDEVRLTVTSDVDDVVHVHGVDRQLVLEGGEPGVLEFEVPPGVPAGRYDVEVHSGAVVLFEIRIL